MMTTVILGLVMLTLLIIASNIGFAGRFTILDAQNKEVSRSVAESCARLAALKLDQNASYAGGEALWVGTYQCYVLPVSSGSDVLHVQSTIRNSYTNLEVSKSSGAWVECMYFDTSGTCVLP